MNLTLSVDDQVVERAREVARRQGASLNALVRAYIERLAGQRTGEQLARDLQQLWKKTKGHSHGAKLRRSDAYSGRS
jgi:hypothetical protein